MSAEQQDNEGQAEEVQNGAETTEVADESEPTPDAASPHHVEAQTTSPDQDRNSAKATPASSEPAADNARPFQEILSNTIAQMEGTKDEKDEELRKISDPLLMPPPPPPPLSAAAAMNAVSCPVPHCSRYCP